MSSDGWLSERFARQPRLRDLRAKIEIGRWQVAEPYDDPEGLNNRTVSDFTIGAARLTSRMTNHFAGHLARLVVTPRALSPAAVRSLSERWLISTEQQ